MTAANNLSRQFARILLLDSGVGGLSVMAAIRQRFVYSDLILCADTAYYPYGQKEPQALCAHFTAWAQTMTARFKPDAVVIACNTATTIALDQVRAALSVPVIGTVPAIKPAAQLSHKGVIAVLATQSTVQGRYLQDLINEHAREKTVLLHESARLVDLAEDYLRGKQVSVQQVHAALEPLFAQPFAPQLDCIVLGCTHFPLLRPLLLECAPAINWIDSGEAIARRTAIILGYKGLQSPAPQHQGCLQKGRLQMFFTSPANSEQNNMTAYALDTNKLAALGLEALELGSL